MLYGLYYIACHCFFKSFEFQYFLWTRSLITTFTCNTLAVTSKVPTSTFLGVIDLNTLTRWITCIKWGGELFISLDATMISAL